jgi:hypothetical protein
LTSTEGLGIGFGEMIPGAGFSAGPRYSKTLLDGHLRVTSYLRGSTKRYYTAGVQGSLSDLWNNRVGMDFSADHFDYSQMPYYGPGPGSRRTGRSDYRLEKTETEIRPMLRPVNGLSLGTLGGFQAVNVGPGTASEYISTDRQHTPERAPGIERQTNYLTGGGFVQFDWRDRPGDPTQGGKYRAEYTKFSDLDLGLYSFYLFTLELRPRLLPRAISNPKLRAQSIRALNSFGDTIAGTLNDSLSDASTSLPIRRAIPRVLKNLPSQRVVDGLAPLIGHADLTIRSSVLKALNHLRETAPALQFDQKAIMDQLLSEARAYYGLHEALTAVREQRKQEYRALDLLSRTLMERMKQALARPFRLLGLRYPPKDMYSAYLAVSQPARYDASAALEFLDNVLDRDLKRLLLPLLDALTVRSRSRT